MSKREKEKAMKQSLRGGRAAYTLLLFSASRWALRRGGDNSQLKRILHMKKKQQLMLACILLFGVLGKADDVGRGGRAGGFLRMGLGARTMGMGGGSAALGDDGYTIYYNPAGLVYLQNRWITSTLHNMALDRHLFFLGFATPLGTGEQKPGMLRAGLGLGWLSSGVSRIDSRDSNGSHLGMLSQDEHSFFFSFALNPHPLLAVGISGKILYNRIPDMTLDGGAFTSSGMGLDFGLMLRPAEWLSMGMVYRDMKARYTWDSQSVFEQGYQTVNEFPLVFQGGVACRGFSGKLVAHADYLKVQDLPGKLLAGLEYILIEQFVLRTGIEGREPAFGFGYRGKLLSAGLQLDYAFVSDEVAPVNSHVMTCSFLF
jgi:hypothetical protein